METNSHASVIDHDEETFGDKIRRKAGILTLIGSGLLSILHTLSHVVPAVGVLGLSFGEKYPGIYSVVSNEYVQLAYLPFVLLSFWYIYRDHKHHKHEKNLREELKSARKRLADAESKLQALKK